MDVDFEDDFIDDWDQNSEDQHESPALESSKPETKEEEDDVDAPPPIPIPDVFEQSEKLDSLRQSLNRSARISNSKVNQLYSLLYCVCQDCELLIGRNRHVIPFSISEECSKSKDLKCDNGVIKHRRFIDGYAVHGGEEKEINDYFRFRMGIIDRAIKPIVQSAITSLKDPLVRSHNRLRTISQKIDDLKKANTELSVQTRQTANRLVRIEKQGKDVDLQGNTDKSDVIIHQQRLQKALTRVYNLKEANESAAAENAELQATIAQLLSKSPKKETHVDPKIVELQKRVAMITASCEQSEEERETVMAQRRVSIGRMNDAIRKLEREISRTSTLTEEVENKIRVMTQGRRDVPDRKKGSRIPALGH